VRLVEIESGEILIDNRDITRTLDCRDLRQRVTIIPQDPVLFSGTLRQNLDPFEEHTDDELWEVLDRLGLRERMETGADTTAYGGRQDTDLTGGGTASVVSNNSFMGGYGIGGAVEQFEVHPQSDVAQLEEEIREMEEKEKEKKEGEGEEKKEGETAGAGDDTNKNKKAVTIQVPPEEKQEELVPRGLLTAVQQGGQNFSVGQRQLIALARSILKRSSIVLLDEASASVDQETDKLISRVIRSDFKGCTIITIAHRIATIIDSDQIIVMSSGEVYETGHPSELLQKENDGKNFRSMVEKLGPEQCERLQSIAEGKTSVEKLFDMSPEEMAQMEIE